ncbi:MAG TPA: plastocyanin/azurin family copper-binding protein [Alphaproteobacteria bacterium]
MIGVCTRMHRAGGIMRHLRDMAPAGAVILVLSMLTACGTGGPAYQPPSADVAAVVEMSGFSFTPATVRVRVGDTVEWRNKSLFTHTVTFDPAVTSDVSAPAGERSVDSGRIPAGEVFRHTFMSPGTFRYICRPHHELGMVGMVVVEPQP